MFQILVRFFEKVQDVIRERKILVYSGAYIIFIWMVSALVFHLVEGLSLFDSFYWAITTTTTVGYGDIVARTLLGKTVAIVVMLSGIGVLGLLLAGFASMMVEKSLLRKKLIQSRMENHIILCGWDKKLEIALQELLAEKKEIVVIAEVEDIPIRHKNLIFIRGDPSDEENLKRANVEKASFALISGDDDTDVLLSAIAVERLRPEVFTIASVSDPKVVQALKKTGVNQVISTDEFFGQTLARTIFVPKLSSFLNRMMITEGMDLHQEKNPKSFVGTTVFDAISTLKNKHDAVLLGIVRDDRLMINPQGSIELNKDDEILYIAKEKLELS